MISCILGSKDRSQGIKNLLTSVYSNYNSINVDPDIVIIDGGSSPDLTSFLKSQKGVTLIEENGLHGVTRAYNRGFRIAKYKWVIWLSDDMVLTDDVFKNTVKRFETLSDDNILAVSLNNHDKHGWTKYGVLTPIGFCTKKLLQKVDFWSEDYITYASDIDFCIKAIGAGATTVMASEIKIDHYLDYRDDVHQQLKVNKDSPRHDKIWKIREGWDKSCFSYTDRIYPNVYVKANDANSLIAKIQNVWKNNSWCNIYVDDLFNMDYLASMNVFLKTGTESFNLTV
jgi:hypothetical protein